MGWMLGRSTKLAPENEALKDNSHPVLESPKPYVVLDMSITDPWEDGQEIVYISIDCHWGVEKLFWETPDALSMSAGFVGDATPNPTYCESCTGRANHTEVVEVVCDPEQTSSDQLTVRAFEAHDPMQGYHRGNDVGTQYRSAIYTTTPGQTRQAREIADVYVPKLIDAGPGAITMKIKPLSEVPVGEYYRAEDEHQQYLFKNPSSCCLVHLTGVAYGT